MRVLIAILAVIGLAFLIVIFTQNDSERAVDELEYTVEEAVEETGEAVDEAGDRINDAVR